MTDDEILRLAAKHRHNYSEWNIDLAAFTKDVEQAARAQAPVCCRQNPCIRPGKGPCDMPAQPTIAPSVAHRGGDTPKGWKLVPIVPTEDMVREGSDNNSTCWDDTTDNGFPDEVSRAVYTAMISVAPESTEDVTTREERT